MYCMTPLLNPKPLSFANNKVQHAIIYFPPKKGFLMKFGACRPLQSMPCSNKQYTNLAINYQYKHGNTIAIR